jgi:hypothetical protein
VDAGGKSNVRTCSELSAGEEIEAWHKGRLFHRGRVTETIPSTDLFWIVDSRTGARKLLDVEALEIVRVEKIIPAETVRVEPGRVEAAKVEPSRVESGRVERAVRGERASVARVARREPHVVWFSSA